MKRIRVRRPNISHRCLVYATLGFGNKIPLPILKEVEIFGTLIPMIPIHIFGGLHDKDRTMLPGLLKDVCNTHIPYVQRREYAKHVVTVQLDKN